MTRLLTLTLTLVLASPLVAHADDAAPHIAKAMEAHKDGRFADALAELQLAYKIDPRPELLFALGQVNVKLDRCADAVSYYQQYLATNPSAQAIADTTEAITTCNAKLAAAAPTPPPTGSPTPAPHTTTPSGPAPWYTDKLGDALVAGGVVVGVVGVFVYQSARDDLDEADRARDLAHYEDLVDSAHGKRTWSILLVGGGVALVGAGVVHYVLRGGTTETQGVGMVPASGGGLVTWGGRF